MNESPEQFMTNFKLLEVTLTVCTCDLNCPVEATLQKLLLYKH